jgi:hypothetical protein
MKGQPLIALIGTAAGEPAATVGQGARLLTHGGA